MKYWVKEYLQQRMKATLDGENDSRIVNASRDSGSYIDYACGPLVIWYGMGHEIV